MTGGFPSRTDPPVKPVTAARSPQPPWARDTDEELLARRLCDLKLRFEGSWVHDNLKEVHEQLARRGLRLRPHAWYGTEWFSPEGEPGIAVPFFLAHPRLARLERRMMLEVEGGNREECLKILRHECGHAFQHAYALHRRRDWQRHFGRSGSSYPEVYRPNPASRRFVQHLRLYYAQSHPDEDFAETFAVWLGPRATWRRRYAEWPALEKLEYVERLMAEIGKRPVPVNPRRRVDPVSQLRRTLGKYYADKRNAYATGFPDIYDRDLKRLFSEDPRHARHERAAVFLRRNRQLIRRLVAKWTGEYQFTLDQVLTDMIGRCRELGLRAAGSERKLCMDFAVLLTARTVHFHYSHRNWIAL